MQVQLQTEFPAGQLKVCAPPGLGVPTVPTIMAPAIMAPTAQVTTRASPWRMIPVSPERNLSLHR